MVRGGILLSACTEMVGEEQKAPVAILVAVFCITSSRCRWVGEAEPYMVLPFITFDLMAAL